MSSKSADKAKKNKDAANQGDCNAGVDKAHKDCPLHKHFFKIKVEDAKGMPVFTVKPKLVLNDKTVIGAVTLDEHGRYDTGKVLPSADACKVSFPELHDVDWWPEGAEAKDEPADKNVVLAEGDCAVKVAFDNGFRDYLQVWQNAKNAKLKQAHPNPNALAAGDELWVPNRKSKVVEKAADKEWKFVLRVARPCKLRMLLVDKDEKEISNGIWTLDAPVAKSDLTSLVEVDNLDATATAGTLKLELKRPAPAAPAAAAPAAPPAGSPPPYPPPIKPEEFKDQDPPKPSDTVEWTLKIGSLPSHKEKRGVLARLHNLGYNCDVGSDDAVLAKVVKSYQKVVLKQDNPTGNFVDIQQTLDDRHSKQ
jgi:hypothetical protein